jgi:hypothetical protein
MFIVTNTHYIKAIHSHILTQGSNVRLSKTKKTLWQGPTHNPLYILARKNGWIIIPIHPQCILNYHVQQSQTHEIMPLIIFQQLTSIYGWVPSCLKSTSYNQVKHPWIMLSPKINYYIIHESNLNPSLIKRRSW